MKKFTYLLPVCALILFCLSLVGYIHFIQTHPDHWNKFDLLAYYNGGRDVIAGRDVYLTGHTYFNFVYTPFAALLFSTIVFIPFETAKYVMTALDISTLVITIVISWILLGYRKPIELISLTFLSSAILLWAQPVHETLFHGQINLLLMLLIMLGFLIPKRPLLQGIPLGIAAGIKLTPLIFIAYLVITRRFKAAAVSLATFAATIGFGFLILPRESARYWTELFYQTGRIGDLTLSGSQSLNAMIVRLFGYSSEAHLYWMISAAIVGICGLLLAAAAYRRVNEVMGLLLCGITGLLISPFSWTHHWTWLILTLPLSLHYVLTRKNALWWIILFLLCVFLLRGRELIFSALPFIHENIYTVFGLLLLLTSAYTFYARSRLPRI